MNRHYGVRSEFLCKPVLHRCGYLMSTRHGEIGTYTDVYIKDIGMSVAACAETMEIFHSGRGCNHGGSTVGHFFRQSFFEELVQSRCRQTESRPSYKESYHHRHYRIENTPALAQEVAR